MKFCCCVPVFNGRKFLRDCLLSVVGQTCRFDGVVVVDDGSRDRSYQVAKEYTSSVYRNNVNRGIGFTRQRLAELCKGDYLCFLSADDAYHPTYLERIGEFADGEVALYTDYYRCDKNLNRLEAFLCPEWGEQNEFRLLAVEWALRQNMFVNFSTVALPKWVFEHVKFDSNLRFGEDLVFLLETLVHDVKWLHVDIPLVYYRVHKDAGTVKAWNFERRRAMWNRLSPLLMMLGVSGERVNSAIDCAMQRETKRRLKNYVPDGLKVAYHALKAKY